MKKKRVLVTGASGFLGKHVVPLLVKNGYDVRTLGRGESNYPGVKHYRVDLGHEAPVAAMRDANALIHLASDVSIVRSIENPASHMTNNLAMTLNALEACRTAEHKPLVVYLSSDLVYGKARGRVTEQSPTFPVEPYTASKIMGEVLLATYANQFGIPYIALRASAFFGPHQPRRSFIADVIQKMKDRDEITVGPLQTIKNFIYVENVAAAVLLALKAPRSAHNHTYNIGGKPIALSQILIQIKSVVEKRLDKKISIRIDQSLQLPTHNEIGPFAVSTVASQKMLKWKLKVPLKKGLESTVDYFLKNGSQ